MNLGVCPFASSSKGNCYMIRSDETVLLLDAGVSGKAIMESFKHLKYNVKEVSGLLLTHEHIDHIKGVPRLLSVAPKCTIYGTQGTIEGVNEKFGPISEEKIHLIGQKETFTIGDIEITSFAISHDAAEPVGYSFKRNNKKITIVTDTGVITDDITKMIADSDVLIIESNHEVNILLYGRYPYHVKHRILSDVGHISNETAGHSICKYLKELNEPKTPYVFLAHLSQENNTPQQAILTIKNILEEEDIYIGKDLKLAAIPPDEMGDFLVI